MHRKIRCVSSPRSTYNRRLPSSSLAGVWLKKAGFEVGDFARITVADGVLVISSERLPDNENREKRICEKEGCPSGQPSLLNMDTDGDGGME